LSYVWGGTAWQQIAGGTAVGNSGLVYVTSATVGASVSSVTITNAFSSTYDNYYVTYTGGTLAGAAAMSCQLGPSSVTGYNTAYYSAIPSATLSSTLNYLLTNNGASFTNVGMGDTSLATFEITLFGPNKALYTTAKVSWLDSRDNFAWGQGGGVHRTAAAFTNIQISAGTNLQNGTVTVYGYRKA
jgi:hypothetical protein